MQRTPLTGAIITAGGQARRFGGDKVLARLEGQTLLQRAAQSLPPAPARLIISAKPAHTLPGWRTVPDVRLGGLGPLCGLETGLGLLRGGQAGWAAFCAADMPHLTPSYWEMLLAQAAPQMQAVVVRDGAGRLQPLAALYHTQILPLVSELLDARELSMNALLSRLRCQILAAELLEAELLESGPLGPQVLDNVNTPADLARAAAWERGDV